MIAFEPAKRPNLIDANLESTAAGAYRARQANITTLLASIGDELVAHGARASTEPSSWGYVGDLGGVQERLELIMKSLAGGE